MTLSEIENSLPNGFHDSGLKSFEVDYERRTVRAKLSLKVGHPDDPRATRNDGRDATLDITGLIYLVVDPPDANRDFIVEGDIWVGDGYETKSIPQFTKHLNEMIKVLPEGAFAYSFFVCDWNSYIHVAGTDCSVSWVGEQYPISGRRKAYSAGETIDE